MAERSEEARLRAEAKFKKKARQAQEGEQARTEYAAAEKAGDTKRAQLKALRLANEASDAAKVKQLRKGHGRPDRQI